MERWTGIKEKVIRRKKRCDNRLRRMEEISPLERTSSPATESTRLETRAREKPGQEILEPLKEGLKVINIEKKRFGEFEKEAMKNYCRRRKYPISRRERELLLRNPFVGIYVLKLGDCKYNPLTVINKVLLL